MNLSFFFARKRMLDFFCLTFWPLPRPPDKRLISVTSAFIRVTFYQTKMKKNLSQQIIVENTSVSSVLTFVEILVNRNKNQYEKKFTKLV